MSSGHHAHPFVHHHHHPQPQSPQQEQPQEYHHSRDEEEPEEDELEHQYQLGPDEDRYFDPERFVQHEDDTMAYRLPTGMRTHRVLRARLDPLIAQKRALTARLIQLEARLDEMSLSPEERFTEGRDAIARQVNELEFQRLHINAEIDANCHTYVEWLKARGRAPAWLIEYQARHSVARQDLFSPPLLFE